MTAKRKAARTEGMVAAPKATSHETLNVVSRVAGGLLIIKHCTVDQKVQVLVPLQQRFISVALAPTPKVEWKVFLGVLQRKH